MSDASQYTYPSPLEGYTDRAPLPTEKAADGKSYINPPSTEKSASYDRFVDPITNGTRGGFDVHIYFNPLNPQQTTFAEELWQRIRYEFPELRIYQVFKRPVGPHLVAMFEVNLFSPAQFGAFVPWLVIHRGPLSALLHPNTGDDLRDHTQRATWLGERMPIDVGLLREFIRRAKD